MNLHNQLSNNLEELGLNRMKEQMDTYLNLVADGKKTMLEAIANDLNTTFASWEERGEAYIVVASSAPEEETLELVEEVKATFPDREVMWDPLSQGTSSHIGYGGLGIGISCRPPRPLK